MTENPQDVPADEPQADEDWKSQVQAEKEADTAEEPAAEEPAAEGVPEASFSTLISVLATQTMVALGEGIPGQQEQSPVQLSLARYHIDTLAVLQEKTTGNLSEEESGMLEQVLYQLRMMYVGVQKQGDAAQD
ncbi:MAG: DUF1844 domain-containing protein [Planctomycetota bacterium]|nr:DUF1844 domain-containing protein [Planctomycetota bacterium]